MSNRLDRLRNPQRANAWKQPESQQNGGWLWSGKPNEREKQPVRGAKQQARNFDPMRVPAEAGVIMGERKVVASTRSQPEKESAACFEGIDPVAGENGYWGVQKRNARSFRLRSSVPGMPVVNRL